MEPQAEGISLNRWIAFKKTPRIILSCKPVPVVILHSIRALEIFQYHLHDAYHLRHVTYRTMTARDIFFIVRHNTHAVVQYL